MSIIFVENPGGRHRTRRHPVRPVVPAGTHEKKGVATALKSALSATGSYLADTCLKLVVFIYAVGYIFGVWG